MHCLYCGKPLGFLKELTDGEFCCSQHRHRYQKLTKLALGRLLETQAETSGDPSGPIPGLQDLIAPSIWEREASKGRPGRFRQGPRAEQMPMQPRPTKEAIKVPAPSVPGFSPASIKPVLTAANPILSGLVPVAPMQFTIQSSLPADAAERVRPRIRTLSELLGRGSLPTLRPGSLAVSSQILPQPSAPRLARSDAMAVRVPEFKPVLAMPALACKIDGPSLTSAEPIPLRLAAHALASAPSRVEILPHAFHRDIVWKDSACWRFSTIELPLVALQEMVSRKSFPWILRGAAAQSAISSTVPFTEPLSHPWSLEPRTAIHYSKDCRFGLLKTGFDMALVKARQSAVKYAAEPVSLLPAAQPVLPRLAADPISCLIPPLASNPASLPVPQARKIPAAIARPAMAVEKLQGSAAPDSLLLPAIRGESALPAASAVPLRLSQPASPATAMLRNVEAIPMNAGRLALPVLRYAPVRQILKAEGAIKEEVESLNVAADPLDIPSGEVIGAPSVLPALGSLFGYARRARAGGTVQAVYESFKPCDQARVPLAYMEMPMPYRRPSTLPTSQLRIVETFEYLRPLDQPVLDPLQALLRLWRTAPVFLRFAAVSACLLLLFWRSAPTTRIVDVVESRWTSVEKSIQDRAAVELVDDFRSGPGNWDGSENWVRTWSFDRAGFVRPGRLALYQPSMDMANYRIEFLAQIERRSIGWVYRAADQENYYASKITIVKPGPLPSLALVRYPVIDGKAGPRVEIPIRVLMHNDTPYRVQLTVQGPNYSTSIEGQLVDFWRDDRLKMGGVGFFADTGERARIYWMKLSHQDDFIGRVCAYLSPNRIQSGSGSLTQ